MLKSLVIEYLCCVPQKCCVAHRKSIYEHKLCWSANLFSDFTGINYHKKSIKVIKFYSLIIFKDFYEIIHFCFYICSLKALSYGAIFHTTCNAILHLRNVN